MNIEWLRTEVYHPLSVHFPITLLLLATLIAIVQMISKKPGSWQKVIDTSLYLGVPLVWLAIYTGDLADGIVSRKICDPTVLKDHENFAYYTAWTFSLVMVLNILLRFSFMARFRRAALILMITLMLGGSVMIAYVGHLGASLVYDQAAGVTVPDKDCSGF